MDRLGNAAVAATSASTPRLQPVSSSTKTHSSSQGGVFISEHLSRILKQYEMSAMSSLKGPAATVAPQPIGQAARSQTVPDHGRVAFTSPVRRSSLPSERLGAHKPLGDDVWSVLAAMAGALKPPAPPPPQPAPLGFLGAPLLSAPALASPFLASAASASALSGLASSAALKERASDTVLEGSRITCFDVGGEKRLCLPQVLNLVLQDFQLPEINRACGHLNIHCSQCSKHQLDVLKMLSVVPLNAASCGLITKTDAERLTSYLLEQRLALGGGPLVNGTSPVDADDASVSTTSAMSPSSSTSTRSACSEPPSASGDEGAPSDPRGAASAHSLQPDPKETEPVADPQPTLADFGDLLPVYHECFGRCRGVWLRSAYTSPEAECVRCDECRRRLTPRRFALHSHRAARESRTCHWGFDARNWRHYLYAAHAPDAAPNARERLDALLDAEKAKFAAGETAPAPATAPSHKRSLSQDKRQETLSFGPPVEKKARCDPVVVGAMNGNQLPGPLTCAPAPAPPLPPPSWVMYDQLLIYHMLAAQFGASAPASLLSSPLVTCSRPAPTSAEEAAAAATLLKLAPQLSAGDHALKAPFDLKPRQCSVGGKELVGTVNGQQEGPAQSCIEPLKKHILHRSMARACNADMVAAAVAGLQQQQQQLDPPAKARALSNEGADNLELMLEQHVGDREALRSIRSKLYETQRQADSRLDHLASENRVLKREIEALRTLSQLGAAGSLLAAGLMP